MSAVTAIVAASLSGATAVNGSSRASPRRFASMRHRYERLQVFFHTHGSKAVFMARFIAGVRFMAGPMAGAAGMPFLRFLGWNLLGAIVWCRTVVTIGYLVGDELYRVTEMAHHAQRWIALAACSCAPVVVLLVARKPGRRAAARP